MTIANSEIQTCSAQIAEITTSVSLRPGTAVNTHPYRDDDSKAAVTPSFPFACSLASDQGMQTDAAAYSRHRQRAPSMRSYPHLAEATIYC